MNAVDPPSSNESPPRRSRLPSPSLLFAGFLLLILAAACLWFGWRVHRQQARMRFLEELGANVQKTPAGPVWLHDLVVSTLGEERAVGLTDVTRVSLEYSHVTDRDLEALHGYRQLESLILDHTNVSDAGLRHLKGFQNLHTLTRRQPRPPPSEWPDESASTDSPRDRRLRLGAAASEWSHAPAMAGDGGLGRDECRR